MARGQDLAQSVECLPKELMPLDQTSLADPFSDVIFFYYPNLCPMTGIPGCGMCCPVWKSTYKIHLSTVGKCSKLFTATYLTFNSWCLINQYALVVSLDNIFSAVKDIFLLWE